MNKQESKERPNLPLCPNPDCPQSHVVRNGSHRGRQRYHCRSCKTYFGETEGTPMYNLKTPAAEVAQALTQVLANDLHLNQVEIDEFWSFVQKKTVELASLTRGNAGDAWSKTGTVAS